MKLSEQATTFTRRHKRPFSEKLDDVLLDPVFGYFFLAVFLFLYFFTVFEVGSFFAALIEIPLEALAGTFAPLHDSQPFLWNTLNGAYMGLAGIAGIVLPYFLPLVFLSSLLEESGYMARIAFLADGIFHKIGLHGKSAVPFILGFGCSVPAIYASRMIERRRDRIVTGLLIPFIPCSARIAVIFSLAAAFAGPVWAIVNFFMLVWCCR
jgi:ferrous iron transport protein B